MDYEYKTTLWEDLTDAESQGETVIEDLVSETFREWKDNVEYLTELIMVLNHKCWYYNGTDDKLSSFYEMLYYDYDELAYDYLSKHNEAGLKYYFETLD